MNRARNWGVGSTGGAASLQGLLGIAIVALLTLACAFAPFLATHGYGDPVGDAWGPASAAAPLGYDNLGRDMLSRLLFGGRVTIAIALGATALACLLGTLLGLLASAAGKVADALLARANDTLMAIPSLVFTIVVLTLVGPSIPALIGVLAVTASTRVFRLARGLGAEIALLDYYEAARLRKESLAWLTLSEMLPNLAAPLATEFGLRLSANFLLMASLSFLGLGVQPPLTDWGSMVRENAGAIGFGQIAPLLPALAIGLFSIGTHLVTDWGLARRDAAGH